MAGVGPHPEGLKADFGEIDPPPEDLGNADEASRVTTLWMRCLTTWPQDGKRPHVHNRLLLGGSGGSSR